MRVGKFEHTWARVGKGGQVDCTDQTEMGDMSSRWVCVSVKVWMWVGVCTVY